MWSYWWVLECYQEYDYSHFVGSIPKSFFFFFVNWQIWSLSKQIYHPRWKFVSSLKRCPFLKLHSYFTAMQLHYLNWLYWSLSSTTQHNTLHLTLKLIQYRNAVVDTETEIQVLRLTTMKLYNHLFSCYLFNIIIVKIYLIEISSAIHFSTTSPIFIPLTSTIINSSSPTSYFLHQTLPCLLVRRPLWSHPCSVSHQSPS